MVSLTEEGTPGVKIQSDCVEIPSGKKDVGGSVRK